MTALVGSNLPQVGLPVDQPHIDTFKGFFWPDATKADAVRFARCSGFRETGMSVSEIGLLYDVLELMGENKTIVELGRDFGTSTRLFLQHLIRHGGRLTSIDLRLHDEFVQVMKRNGYLSDKGPEINFVVGDSMKVAWPKEEKIHFLLIDTEHALENALGEYMRWRVYLESGAFIAFHDAVAIPGVVRAIEIVQEVEGDRLFEEISGASPDGFGIRIFRRR